MERNVMDILRERGYLKQVVFEEDLYKLLGEEKVAFYIGFDPTADSLHVGHYVALMAMAHMQRCGHKPIALIGGGTAMIGDPSGRTDMRNMMTKEEISHNVECFKKQMARFIDFSQDKAILVDNADWLLSLNYVEFIRDIGAHFSVNKMLTAECFKRRLEKGLSFLEFNYMLMQAYDFLELYNRYGCLVELGGDDQWNNILAGADLIRRKAQKPAYAMTFALLSTADGNKMGKTQKGAIWLDESKTSSYDFYQYWRNVEDSVVENCFKLLTFVELDEIQELTKYKDERMNQAKIRLAYEITKLVHGEEKAELAKIQAQAAFSNDSENMQTVCVKVFQSIVDLLIETKICASKGEARRLIEGGGIKINDTKVDGIDFCCKNLPDSFILHKGKKVHLKIEIEK